MNALKRFKSWVNHNKGQIRNAPIRNKVIANMIWAYSKDKDAAILPEVSEVIPTPSSYQSMKVDKGKGRADQKDLPKSEMERQWEEANGINDDWVDGNYEDDCDFIGS